VNVCVSYSLICQCVIRVDCDENYTRNTQMALVCTLVPVSYTLLRARWTSVCTKLGRRGRDVEQHRRTRCDGSSAPCSGGPQISPHGCAAGAEAPLMLAGQTRTFTKGGPHREVPDTATRTYSPLDTKTADTLNTPRLPTTRLPSVHYLMYCLRTRTRGPCGVYIGGEGT